VLENETIRETFTKTGKKLSSKVFTKRQKFEDSLLPGIVGLVLCLAGA
jgi:hypothetical protein